MAHVSRKPLYGVTWLALASGVIAVVLAGPKLTSWLPPCMFHEITGLYCPGCGSTRAVLRLIQGNIAGALRANTLLFVLIPYVLFLAGSQAKGALSRGRYKPGDVPNWVAYTVVGVLVFFWIARNIPVYPFTLLAPK